MLNCRSLRLRPLDAMTYCMWVAAKGETIEPLRFTVANADEMATHRELIMAYAGRDVKLSEDDMQT